MKYGLIPDIQHEFPVQAMCRVFKINRSWYYAWLSKPLPDRAIENHRLLKRIQAFHVDSDGSPLIYQCIINARMAAEPQQRSASSQRSGQLVCQLRLFSIHKRA